MYFLKCFNQYKHPTDYKEKGEVGVLTDGRKWSVKVERQW